MDQVTAALRNIRKSVVEYNETSNMPRAVVGQIAELQEALKSYREDIDYEKFLELQQKTQNKKKVEKDQKSDAYRSKVQSQNSEKAKEQARAKEREQRRHAAAVAHEKAKSDRRNQIDATLPQQIGGFKKI
jgi:hypothetical protein